MAVEMRELYSSPNGDRWYLDVDLGQVFIRHEPNFPSGGVRAIDASNDFPVEKLRKFLRGG